MNAWNDMLNTYVIYKILVQNIKLYRILYSEKF